VPLQKDGWELLRLVLFKRRDTPDVIFQIVRFSRIDTYRTEGEELFRTNLCLVFLNKDGLKYDKDLYSLF
jgi:hypothetical protein